MIDPDADADDMNTCRWTIGILRRVAATARERNLPDLAKQAEDAAAELEALDRERMAAAP